jgi:hypothetical protein
MKNEDNDQIKNEEPKPPEPRIVQLTEPPVKKESNE